MAEVCDLCGVKSDNPARHRDKFKAKHAEIEAQRAAEAKQHPAPPPPPTPKESIIDKAAKWLKT